MSNERSCNDCPFLSNPVALVEHLAERLTPNDCRSMEDWQRLHHRDLAELPDNKLAREAMQIRAVLPFLRPQHPDAPWLAERLSRLEAEARRRGHGGR